MARRPWSVSRSDLRRVKAADSVRRARAGDRLVDIARRRRAATEPDRLRPRPRSRSTRRHSHATHGEAIDHLRAATIDAPGSPVATVSRDRRLLPPRVRSPLSAPGLVGHSLHPQGTIGLARARRPGTSRPMSRAPSSRSATTGARLPRRRHHRPAHRTAYPTSSIVGVTVAQLALVRAAAVLDVDVRGRGCCVVFAAAAFSL
jgi:hypothetical protein